MVVNGGIIKCAISWKPLVVSSKTDQNLDLRGKSLVCI